MHAPPTKNIALSPDAARLRLHDPEIEDTGLLKKRRKKLATPNPKVAIIPTKVFLQRPGNAKRKRDERARARNNTRCVQVPLHDLTIVAVEACLEPKPNLKPSTDREWYSKVIGPILGGFLQSIPEQELRNLIAGYLQSTPGQQLLKRIGKAIVRGSAVKK